MASDSASEYLPGRRSCWPVPGRRRRARDRPLPFWKGDQLGRGWPRACSPTATPSSVAVGLTKIANDLR
ncbi:hypothetical protein ABK046_47555, partial [Streptomyces caeruleatus]